jgi:hypothetical protein
VEACETSRGVDAVGRGEDAGGAAYALAVAITATIIVIFAGSHCCRIFATVASVKGLKVRLEIVGC